MTDNSEPHLGEEDPFESFCLAVSGLWERATGSAAPLSRADFDIISNWYNQGATLGMVEGVVIEAFIRGTRNGFVCDADGHRIRSLRYFDAGVLERASAVGAGIPSSDTFLDLAEAEGAAGD